VKIKQKKTKYMPITITCETREEAEALFDIIMGASPQTDAQLQLIRWAEEIEWDYTVLRGE